MQVDNCKLSNVPSGIANAAQRWGITSPVIQTQRTGCPVLPGKPGTSHLRRVCSRPEHNFSIFDAIKPKLFVITENATFAEK
jgi:hypothetical protein